MSGWETFFIKIGFKKIFNIYFQGKEENKKIENFLNDTLFEGKEDKDKFHKFLPIELIENKSKGIFITKLYEFIINNHILIIGNPGSGKTQLLKKFGLEYKEGIDTIKDLEGFIPFYISLKNLSSGLEDYIQQKILQFKLKGEQKFLLLLDGLDEIDTNKSGIIIDELNNLKQHKIIITSRKSSSNIGLLDTFDSNIKKYKIKEFNFKKDTSLLEEYFTNHGKDINLEIYKKQNIEIKDILYLEIYFKTYENLSVKDGKLELVEKYLNLEFSKSNLNKYSLEYNFELIELITDIVHFLYDKKTLIISKKEISKIIETNTNYKNLNFFDIKEFVEKIIKTLFIELDGKYTFSHKIFYEYFLVRFISNNYLIDNRNIRNGKILLDENFIKTFFFPYLQKYYKDKENYAGIISLNMFMQYYLDHNPIDEVDRESIIKSFFELPKGIINFYLSENSPIYSWFNNFYMLNWNTIKIALDYGYINIANELYERLELLISNKKKEREKLVKKIKSLKKDRKNYHQNKMDIKDEIESLFQGFGYQNMGFIRKKYKKKSYVELYNNIKEYGEIYIEKTFYPNDIYKYPAYALFDDIIKNGTNEDILEILNYLKTANELYIFLQIGYKIENISVILGNKDIINLLKKLLKKFENDFNEIDEVILFSRFIFDINKKNIYNDDDYKKLKERTIFDRHFGFTENSINNTQLIGYIYIKEFGFDEEIENKKSKILNDPKNVYLYTYFRYINSILNNEKIDIKKYLDDIKYFFAQPMISDNFISNIKNPYGELLAYIINISIKNNYQEYIDIIIKNIGKEFNQYDFYKTLKTINTNILKELEISEIILSIKEYYLYDNYPAEITNRHLFLSSLYGLEGRNLKQVEIFEKGLTNSYIRYGFRKDDYLVSIFNILEELKKNHFITEKIFFEELDKIIELYKDIEYITEKGVKYLGLEIIDFILTFNIEKAEKYFLKINNISNMFEYKIEANIIIEKIKNIYNFEIIEKSLENYWVSGDAILYKLKIYLYIIDTYSEQKERYGKIFNETLSEIDKEISYFYDYFNENDLILYSKLYKKGLINKFEQAEKQIDENLKKSEIPKEYSIKKEFEENYKENNKKKIFKLLDSKYLYWRLDIYSKGYYIFLYEIFKKSSNKYLLLDYITRFNDDFQGNILDYRLFVNITGFSSVLIKAGDKEKAIQLFNEGLKFAKLLIK